MGDKILLCYTVNSADLQHGVQQFKQFDWQFVEPDAEPAAMADSVIIFGKPNPANLLTAERLKWLQLPSAGAEIWAASEAYRKGKFELTTAAGIHDSCAEHALALLLGITRRVGLVARGQETGHWKMLRSVATPQVLRGRIAGILGLGSIGRRVAEVLRALGMYTIGVSMSGSPVPFVDEVFPFAKLDEQLPRFDVLIMVLPATPATDNLLNAERIAKLQRHCIVINVGRGNCIDEDALLAALREDRIAGAGLDVFKTEPLPTNSEFYWLPNVVMTPHIGGDRPDYGRRAFEVFLQNLDRFVHKQPLLNLVGRERGY